MGYIKFVIKDSESDADGNTVNATIGRIESDMAGVDQLDTNLIFHALTSMLRDVEQAGSVFPFILDYSKLA